ncbi:MAG: hypothetical protein AB7D03_11580 [Thiomicrospira sp.]
MIKKFVTDLNKYLNESGESGQVLARKVGVAPSRITAWKKGEIQRYSHNVMQAHLVINNYFKSEARPIPEEIETLVRELITNDASEKALINLLKQLKQLKKAK